MNAKKTEKTKDTQVRFPLNVLQPILNFLQGEEKKLVNRKKSLDEQDPFEDETRVDDNASDDTDAAEQVGHAQVSAMRRQVDKRLIQVRKALTRLKLGSYGNCEKCGRMIDTDRLMVKPEATTCVSCEREKES